MRFLAVVLLACLARCAVAEVSFSGETTHFAHSCYIPGEKPEAVFEGAGFAANGEVSVDIGVKDAFGASVKSIAAKARADAGGRWRLTVQLPCAAYGAFRVYAKAAGIPLADAGTRGGGYLTYAVVPDPAKRPHISEEDAFLGLHGGTPFEAAFLGAHWRLDATNLRWPSGDDADRRKRDALLAKYPWESYYFITASRIFQRPKFYSKEALEYFGGKLPMIGGQIATEKGARYCAEALSNLARAAIGAENRGQKHRVYEIFWEPELHYTCPAEIVRAAKIAYRAIKDVDPDGIVAAPSPYTINSYDMFRDYFDRGLADYMDAVSMHPYGDVEGDDIKGRIRALRRLVRERKGRDLDFYGTESGMGSDVTPESELRQAQKWIRTLATLLGEGFRFHHVFYGFDWGSDGNNVRKGGSGLMYNLDYPKSRWEPVHLSPKPSFAAISAFSLAVDGLKSTCDISDLGGSRTGYAYSDRTGARCVAVLWDVGEGSEVEFESGRETTLVADLMGNVRKVASPGGRLKLALSPSVTYVLNANPALWGMEGRLAKALRGKVREEPEPLKVASVSPAFFGGVAGISATISNEGNSSLETVVSSRIRGIPEARLSKKVRVAARSVATVNFAFDGRDFAPAEIFRAQIAAVSGAYRAEWSGDVNFLLAPRGGHAAAPSNDLPLAFSWDGEGLHAAIRPTADAFEVKFAKCALKGRSLNGFADTMKEAVQTLRFAEGGANRVKTYHGSRPQGPVGTISVEKAGTAERMVYRIFIPWRELGFSVPPVAGDTLRVSMDGFFPSSDDNPRQFGHVVLGNGRSGGI